MLAGLFRVACMCLMGKDRERELCCFFEMILLVLDVLVSEGIMKQE